MKIKIEHIGICKLCNRSSSLEKSHAIPRSVFKQAKKGSGQLVVLKNDTEFKPFDTNIDPKEYLLCKKCEHFLSTEYEKNSLEYLRNPNNFNTHENFTEIVKINYEKFYLFLISILWRASLSKSSFYEGVCLPEEFEDVLKSCIVRKRIRMQTSIKLDQVIPVSIVKLKDSHKILSDKALKTIIMPFYQESDETNKTHQFQVSFNGYLFIYWLKAHKDLHALRTYNPPERLQKAPFKMNHIDIRELSAFIDAFDSAKNYSSKN
jgi:hypothetical protein